MDEARDLANAFNRLDRRTQIVLTWLLIAIAIAAAVTYYVARHRNQTTTSQQQQQAQTSSGTAATGPAAPPSLDQAENLLLGNPSDATPDAANRNNYLMVKKYFTLSYNDEKGTPNWVSWRVTAADLGFAKRKQGEFSTDWSLPRGFKPVTHADYTGSGFDRGHMCPHSDRAADNDMSENTFVMTNIIPQAPNVNQRAWEQLEEYGRELVKNQHVRLYIISGPTGQGGTGYIKPPPQSGAPGRIVHADTIGHGRVVVPAACWKIIVVAPETGGPLDPSAITADARVIAVLMPNDHTMVGDPWTPYRTTVQAIEEKTGYHFFDRLKPEVAAALRMKKDDVYVAPPKPKKYSQ